MKALLVLLLAAWAPLATAQPLSLEEALRVGEAQSPRLAAQRQAVVSAEQQTGRAAELPDPKLRFGIENLPINGPDQFRYDREPMTQRVVGVAQEFPNQAKRQARNDRAGRARDVEQAMLASERAALHRDVAVAWLDAHFAERSRAAVERLAGQLAVQSDTLAPAVAAGRQSAADGFMVRGALEQARDRILDLERLIERSRIALAALLGPDARRPLADAPDFGRLPQGRDALLTELEAHPHLRTYDVRLGLAQSEVELARASRESDWSLEVGYGQRRPAFDNMISVTVAIDLPWQAEKRQDRDIASRLAELERARAQREDARRAHEAELRGYLADYDSAARRLARYRATLVPLARERADATLAAYRGGRGELVRVLEAQRGVTDTELAALAIEAEQAKAWANLSYLYPHEGH